MDCRTRLIRYLTENGVNFEVREHEQAFTAQRVAATEHVDGWMFAKVVMVLVDGDLQMLVLPAPERVDLDVVALALGAHEVTLANERDFAGRFEDCELGAMPPFGNLYDVPVVADTTLAAHDRIVFEAGTHRTTLTLPWADYVRLARPEIVDFGTAAVAAV